MTEKPSTDDIWLSQAAMLNNRIKKNRKKLKRTLARENISCYRVYDRDIPEIPIAVDVYGDKLHISFYAGTKHINPIDAKEWLECMSFALCMDQNILPENVFIKERKRAAGGSQYGQMANNDDFFEVTEHGHKFCVNLSDYLDSGLFLDHRNTRSMVQKSASGKHFLNLFAYTGSFSVYAGKGGAATTTTVDMSNTYLDWAKRNMAINGLSGPKHRFIKEDILGALENRRIQNKYDLVVIDPPTVSKSKSMERNFDIQNDHILIINRVLEICNAGATIFFSTNFQKFKLHADKLNHRAIAEISHQTVPFDFRNKKIHRCWLIKK